MIVIESLNQFLLGSANQEHGPTHKTRATRHTAPLDVEIELEIIPTKLSNGAQFR
jgi:hypothetical protein